MINILVDEEIYCRIDYLITSKWVKNEWSDIGWQVSEESFFPSNYLLNNQLARHFVEKILMFV